MKNILLLLITVLFIALNTGNAQNTKANKSTAYAVKANTHKKKHVPRSVTRKHGHSPAPAKHQAHKGK